MARFRVPDDASVGTRLLAAFGLIIALAVVGAVLAITSLVRTAGEIGRLTGSVEPLKDHNADALLELSRAQAASRGYSLSLDPAFLPDYQRDRQAVLGSLAQARDLAPAADLGEEINAQEALAREYFEQVADPGIALRQAGLPAQPDRTIRGRLVVERFGEENRRTAQAIEAIRSQSRSRVQALARNASVGLLVLLVGGTTLAVVVAVRSARSVTDPIQGLRRTLAALEAGHLDRRAEPAGPVELRAAADSVNALAAETERLSRLQSRRVERERLIRRITRAVHEHLEVTPLLERSAAELHAALEVDRVVLQLTSPNEVLPYSVEHTGPGVVPLGVQVALPPPVEVVELLTTGGTQAIVDVNGDVRLPPGARRHLQSLEAVSALLAPLRGGGDLIGVITLVCTADARTWAEDDVAVLEAVAREVASAIGHAETYRREREMVVQLQELDRTKTDFVSSVSHELRTPLTSIVGYLEMLTEGEGGDLTPMQRQMLSVADRNSRRLLALIEDLLTLSRIESGAFKVTLAPTDIRAVIETARLAVTPSASERGQQLVVDLAADLRRVLGDAPQLERVLLNLLSNAIKFTPLGGRVTVSAEQRGESVAVSVADNGIGIPSEEQHRLFTRFFRTSVAQEKAIQGTGLGLAIVKSIVEHHGGTITVDSVIGEGTTFTVTLPTVVAASNEMGVR